MNRTRSFLALAISVFIAGTLHANSASVATNGKALQILSKHCFECHGPGGRAYGAFSLFDRAALTQLANPNKADSSELLDLVAGGVMPPGKKPKLAREEVAILRDWINNGAPALLTEEYVWNVIATDAETLGANRRTTRYLTLHHRLAAGDSAANLDTLRKQLNGLLQHLSGKKDELFTPVDPAETVLRLDLKQLDWDTPPMVHWKYKGTKADGKPDYEFDFNPPFNRFDMLLLEYPYGYIPSDNNKAFNSVVKDFFKVADPIRPIPAVRVDWLLARASTGKLQAILRTGTGERPALPQGLDTVYNESVGPNLAAAELGIPMKEIKVTPRAEWEKDFAKLIVAKKIGIPITLDDSILQEDVSRNLMADLSMSWRNPKTDEPITSLQADEEAYFVLKNNGTTDVYIDVNYTTINKKDTFRNTFTPVLAKVAAGGTWLLRSKEKPAKFDADDVGEMWLIIYARSTQFPQGHWFRTADKVDFALSTRIMHPFFQIDDGGQLKPNTDANTISRHVVKLTIKPK